MTEKIKKLTQKFYTWNKWIRGFADSIIIGALTAATGTAGLSHQNILNFEWETVKVLAITGALGGILKHFMQNPLSSIGKAPMLLTAGMVLLLFSGCSTLRQTMTLVQEFEGSGSVSVSTRVGTGSAVIENARREGGIFKADKLDLVANEH